MIPTWMTHDLIVDAANEMVEIEQSGTRGLCYCFQQFMYDEDAYELLPKFFRSIGANQKGCDGFFPCGYDGRKERLMMLAFMLTWSRP